MKVLVSAFLLLLPAMLTVSSRPNPGVAKSHGDQRQASGRWLQEGGQECECRDWFLRAPKRKSTPVLESPKKQCPCDHVKDSEKKNSKFQEDGLAYKINTCINHPFLFNANL
ncbi:C-X-C motif chemokine 17 [Lemmus lemmus]